MNKEVGNTLSTQKKNKEKLKNKISNSNTLIIVVLFVILILMIYLVFNLVIEIIKINKSPTVCGDGTSELECSINKPYFCEDGFLKAKASICGCPGAMKQLNDKCTSDLYKKSEKRYFEYFLDGTKGIIEFEVYEEVLKHITNKSRIIIYNGKEAMPSYRDFILKDIDDPIQRQALMPLVVEIQNLAKDKDTQAKIAISLVQRIPYGNSQKRISFVNFNLPDYRYPYEVIYDNKGVCGEKSELLIFLLKELGFGTASFYYKDENHAAVGIKCPVKYSFRNSGYCFIETTGPAIISAHQNNYVGPIKLKSTPEIIPISDGVSLSENLDDYKDSEKWIYLNKLLEKDGYLNYFRNLERNRLIKKYGLGSFG